MRFLLTSLICLQLVAIGCRDSNQNELGADSKHTHVMAQIPVAIPAEEPNHEAKDAETGKATTKHLGNFLRLLPNNPVAAWRELEKVAKVQYGNHHLVDEWVELTFVFTSGKKALILELIRYYEIEMQMLTDIDAEKHADEINRTLLLLNQLRAHVKQLEAFEIDPETHKVGFKLSIKLKDD